LFDSYIRSNALALEGRFWLEDATESRFYPQMRQIIADWFVLEICVCAGMTRKVLWVKTKVISYKIEFCGIGTVAVSPAPG
jgi:hypothetical protein